MPDRARKGHKTIDQLAREQGVKPVKNIHKLRGPCPPAPNDCTRAGVGGTHWFDGCECQRAKFQAMEKALRRLWEKADRCYVYPYLDAHFVWRICAKALGKEEGKG